jgi:hypothetical protein
MAMRVSYHREVVKLIFLCSRRPGTTHAQYATHLLERHAPLALRHHASLRRYVLNVVDGDDAIDSVNALHYEALEDFERRNYDSAEGERIVTEDHARFLGGAAGYLTRESVVRGTTSDAAPGARSPGVKWICALRGDAGPEAELVSELLTELPGVSGLVIDRVERKLYDAGADWNTFLEIRLASDEDAASLRGRIARLTDASAVWRVAEHVQRA